ncbi:MAG: NAD(+)/NADH kinase [Acidobacteriota bacterium]
MATVGILANPLSGRDVRRLAARASTTTLEHKRDQVARIAVGAVAAGAEKLLLLDEPFRVSSEAVRSLGLDAEIDLLDVGASLTAADTVRATEAMRDAGCAALVVLGGDGTSRIVSTVWRDAPLLPLSTGTNNVFPLALEATAAGAAAGVVATGAARLEECSRRAKIVRVETGATTELALIDAGLIADDHLGNLMPFDGEKIRRLVLTRAEPDSVGMSPIGGLLESCGRDDEAGVVVDLDPKADVDPLLVPLSPGLYRQLRVTQCRRVDLGEPIELSGPGLVELDGDRTLQLEAEQTVTARVEREGPRVIDASRALQLGSSAGAFRGRSEEFCAKAFHGAGCC